MKKIFIKIIILTSFFYLNPTFCKCNELMDFTIDEKIKESSNVNAIKENELPSLPVVENYLPQEYKTTTNNKVITNTKKIPAGKKFETKLLTNLSGYTSIGSRFTLETIYPFYYKDIIIPAKTILRGTVIDSHKPQITGNGALLVLSINEINYNNTSFPMKAKVIKLNGEKIFFNNIKGDRCYFKNFSKAIAPTNKIKNKMLNVSSTMSLIPIAQIFTPIPTTLGSVVAFSGIAASPFVSLFMKGKNLNIKSGSYLTIKLQEDLIVY